MEMATGSSTGVPEAADGEARVVVSTEGGGDGQGDKETVKQSDESVEVLEKSATEASTLAVESGVDGSKSALEGEGAKAEGSGTAAGKPATEEMVAFPEGSVAGLPESVPLEGILPSEGGSTGTDKPVTTGSLTDGATLPVQDGRTESGNQGLALPVGSTGDEMPVALEVEAATGKPSADALSLPLEKLAGLSLLSSDGSGDKQDGGKPPVENLLKEAAVQSTELLTENQELQKRVVLYAKRRSSVNVQLFVEGHDTEYQASLTEWAETKSKLERMRADYERRINDMREQLREKQLEADEAHSDFSNFKWKVAREAEHSVYGRNLSRALLDKMRSDEREADLERESLRIQGRQLRSQLARLEQALKRKDQLTGGLHLVDYEQLKMENEVMTEKLASKNEEISKLKKKTTYVVHVVTHLREKLQQVQKDVEVESEALEAVEKDLLKGREDLQELNAKCTVLRLKKARLQKNVVNITNPMLLDDLELHKEEAEAVEKKVAELQNRFNLLQMQVHEQKAVLRSYTGDHETVQSKVQPVEVGRRPKKVATDHLRWGVYRRKPVTKHYHAP